MTKTETIQRSAKQANEPKIKAIRTRAQAEQELNQIVADLAQDMAAMNRNLQRSLQGFDKKLDQHQKKTNAALEKSAKTTSQKISQHAKAMREAEQRTKRHEGWMENQASRISQSANLIFWKEAAALLAIGVAMGLLLGEIQPIELLRSHLQ